MIDLDNPNVSTSEYMLTTIDNPWNPFTHYDEWCAYDIFELAPYHLITTNGYLARICHLAPTLSEADTKLEIYRAMNEIVKFQPFTLAKGIDGPQKVWKIVSPNDFE